MTPYSVLPFFSRLSVRWMIIPGGNFISISFVISTFGRFWQKLFCKMTEIILAKAKREIQGGNNQRPAILFWKSNYSLSVLICFYEMLSNVKFRTSHKINPTRLTNKGLIASAVFLSQILNWCNKLSWPNFSKQVPFAFSLQLHPKMLCFQRQKGKEKNMGLRRYLPLLNKLLLWVDWRNNHNL